MNTEVEKILGSYPIAARERLLEIRKLIYAVAAADQLGEIEETIKWGEPSYLSKYGSTVRIDWKLKHADNVNIYFNCKTNLIDAYRILYSDTLIFQGNRAIVLPITAPLPRPEIEHCIALALQYHKIKHLPMLGLSQQRTKHATGFDAPTLLIRR